MEEYNNYMNLSKALESITNNSVLSELSLGLFTSRALTSARGILAGYNNDSSGLSNGLYTQLDYNYGRAVALVTAGTPELVIDEQLRRFGYAVASVNGDSSYKLGIHFDQLQLEWAEAVAPSLTGAVQPPSPWRQTQALWSPNAIVPLIAWYDGQDRSKQTINNGRLTWEDSSTRNNTATDTIGNATLVNNNYVTFNNDSRMFLSSSVSFRVALVITRGLTSSEAVSALFGQNTTDSSGQYTFVRLDTDYDISVDGGSNAQQPRSATVRYNGENAVTGENVDIPNVTHPPTDATPTEMYTISYNSAQTTDFFSYIQASDNQYYMDGDLGQLLFFSAALSFDVQRRLEGYFAPRYGITLPDGHPHKNILYIDPFRIQAEDFADYFDNTPENNQGGAYRDTGVDIETKGNVTNVGWWLADEWLEYEVEIKQAGDYNVTARLSSGNSFAGQLRRVKFAVDGQESIVSTTQANGWTSYSNYNGDSLLTLSVGVHRIRVTLLDNAFNFDWWELTAVYD